MSNKEIKALKTQLENRGKNASSNPKEAKEFLQRAGIISRTGKLKRAYGGR